MADPKKSRSYRDAGVDIDAGDALVEAIKPFAKATARAGTAAGRGGFGALFDLKAAGYRDPILVATTDGVGTKLKIAIAANRHDTIGIDLVAMCVNDLVVQGAEPLFFLDYFATGKLAVEQATAIVKGIAAAFGAVVLGLESDGLHSNGFSLVRRVVEDAGMSYTAAAPFAPSHSLAAELLRPTRLYVKPCLTALKAGGVKAYAHITGGGLGENGPRVLPDGFVAEIDAAAWTLPPVFTWLARTAGIARDEMARTFNCGIGMVAIAAPDRADAVARALTEAGERVHRIGRIVKGAGAASAHLVNLERAWPG